MKTQGKNQVLSIIGAPKKDNIMMCSFRCDRDLWNNFAIYCLLTKQDKTSVLLEYISDIVDANKAKIDAYKQLN